MEGLVGVADRGEGGVTQGRAAEGVYGSAWWRVGKREVHCGHSLQDGGWTVCWGLAARGEREGSVGGLQQGEEEKGFIGGAAGGREAVSGESCRGGRAL